MKTLLSLLSILTLALPALALNYDQNVTPDVIFGSGNANGSFTTDVNDGVELGLRGKLRFDSNNLPQNTFNSNGDGSYFFGAGAAPGGFGWLPGSPTTPVWNFEFTVNTDVDGTSGLMLGDLTYELGLDFDPGFGTTNFLAFDPITPPGGGQFYDHAMGDNTTTSATKVIATSEAAYIGYLGSLIVAQNSWNYEFFNDAPFDTFDPAVDAVYEIYLAAFDGTGAEVARTTIEIIVGNAVANEAETWSGVKTLYR